MIRAALLTCLALLAFADPSSEVRAQALKVPEVKIEAQELAPGVHVLVGGGGNVGVSAGEDGIFIIDDNLEPLTPQLIDAVGRIASGPIRFVINTHWHFDHVGGNKVLGEAGALIVAHDNVRVRMSAPQFIEALGNKVPASAAEALPVITFDQALTLHLNGDTVQVFHVANAHTDGDAIVHFKQADVVHMGDTFFNGSYPFIDTSTGGSLTGMIAGAERVLALADGNTVIIPGHGPVTDRAGLASYRNLLVTVRDRVAALIEQGRSRDEVLAAKPLADLDSTYGKGFMGPERFLGIVYDDLARGR
jgi:glyoxylase-like metal-dependent hydrolase (beta-lactamase superfamily II)